VYKYHYVCEAFYCLLRVANKVKILSGVLLLTSKQVIFVITSTLETINRQETGVVHSASNLGTARKVEDNLSTRSAVFSLRSLIMAVSWKSDNLNWNQMAQFKYILRHTYCCYFITNNGQANLNASIGLRRFTNYSFFIFLQWFFINR
jgi:hypothetical protein